MMRLVILESPYAGDIEKNVEYARACVRDSLSRGEAPIASHLLYTQPGILRDENPHERQWGIDAGLAWKAVAQGSVVYCDLGISKGMEYGMAAAKEAGLPVDIRYIHEKPFSAKENLRRVLDNKNWINEIDPETLKAAEAALKRMDAGKEEDIEEWASRLAGDLAQFKD
jgi:hypothetical protein